MDTSDQVVLSSFVRKTDSQVEHDSDTILCKTSPSVYSSINDDSFSIVWNELSYEVNNSALNLAYHTLKRLKFNVAGIINQHNNGDIRQSSVFDRNPETSRLVFSNLNGMASSNEILAILGPSGTGKTSLLNALIGKKTKCIGGLYLIGNRHNREGLTMSFVPQRDCLNESLTVKECLYLASRMKNVSNGFNHEANVRRISEKLHLSDCLDTRCNMISGGEYKRTSIGQELMSDPDLLVLDEPTSGLDSYTSKKLLLYLKQLISKGSNNSSKKSMSIVLTIHQPGLENFYLFDRVYIMGDLGRVIYDGPPKDALNTITSLIKLHHLSADSHEKFHLAQEKQSPVSFLLDLASNCHGEKIVEVLSNYQRHQHSKKLIENHIYLDATKILKSISINELRMAPKVDKLTIQGAPRSSSWLKTNLLVKNVCLTFIRDPTHILYSLLFYIAIALLLVWIKYSPHGTDSGQHNFCPVIVKDLSIAAMIDKEQGILKVLQETQLELDYMRENLATMAMTSSTLVSCSSIVSSLIFPIMMPRLIKEVHNGWYESSGVVVATVCILLIRDFMLPMLVFMLIYGLTGNAIGYLGWRVLTTSVVVGLMSLIGGIIGTIIGCILSKNPAAAVVATIATVVPTNLLSGIAVRVQDINWAVIRYISWGSFQRMGNSLVLLIRYGYNQCQCERNLEHYMRNYEARFVDLPDTVEGSINYGLDSAIKNSISREENHQLPATGLNHVRNYANALADMINPGHLMRPTCEQYQSLMLHHLRIDQQGAVYSILGMMIYMVILITLLVSSLKNTLK